MVVPQHPRGRSDVRDRLQRATLWAAAGLRGFGAIAGVGAVLILSPDRGGGVPAAVTVTVVVINSLAMMATARRGLRQPGYLRRRWSPTTSSATPSTWR